MSTVRSPWVLSLFIAGGFAGCDKKGSDAPTNPPAAASPAGDPAPADATAAAGAPTDDPYAALNTILAADHRKADNKARDGQRHPAETLEFFGVRPEHHVVELWPGGGWYTEILAPYVAGGGGKLTVTLYDKDGPKDYYGSAQAQRMLDRFAAEAAVFGAVQHVVVPQKITFKKKEKGIESIEVLPFSLGEPGTADVVLTF
ncbi:MAG: hypothetical protein AAF721_20590, partial [Myxococcota bacterium]